VDLLHLFSHLACSRRLRGNRTLRKRQFIIRMHAVARRIHNRRRHKNHQVLFSCGFAVALEQIEFLDEAILGKGVNYKFVKGRNILHLGIEANNEKVVHWIIERGASLEETTGMGETPLLLACKFGNPTIVKHLLTAKKTKKIGNGQ